MIVVIGLKYCSPVGLAIQLLQSNISYLQLLVRAHFNSSASITILNSRCFWRSSQIPLYSNIFSLMSILVPAGLFTSRESTGCWLDKCKSMAADRCLYVKSADTPLAISFTIDHAGRGNHNIKLLKTYLLHHGIKAIQCVNSGSCYCLTVSAIPSVLQYKWSENKENLVSAVKVNVQFLISY